MKRRSINQLSLLSFLFFIIPFFLKAEIKLSKLFSDGVVLQRDQACNVWGWGDAREVIEVSFNNKKYSAKPDESGKWLVSLDPMPAGGPHEIYVKGLENEFLIKDVLFGDVWVCSGQSNMEWTVKNSNNPEEEIANANDSKIRHFKVPHSTANQPEQELAGGEWMVCKSENAGDFTAVGYYFARELRKHVDVPIGLLNTSWGGSRVEPWMSAESLAIRDVDNLLAEVEKQAKARFQNQLKKMRGRLGFVPTEDKGLVEGMAHWANPNLNDTQWRTINVPSTWEAEGYEAVDGIAWYRTYFELSAEDLGKDLKIHLGPIDDSDMSWVNGHLVGEMNMAYSTPRVYEVSKNQVRAGMNNITVRVEDTGGGGGLWGEPDQLFVEVGDRKISLTGDWKFQLGAVKSYNTFRANQTPVILYNKMIYPLLDFPIKGALWYQGESNAGAQDAFPYRDQFATMIKDWRQRWGCGEFPFLFVQLANFMKPDAQPTESSWAVLRESQSATLSVPNTAQAVIIDIGEANDIHPRNKQDVGLRLSLAARKLAYGEDLVYSGPTYKRHKVEDGKVLIEFDHAASGLVAKNKYGYVNSFAIAGADKKFHWAQASIQGNKVWVWSPKVKNPVAVRYGWGNNPDDANLYNAEGLPTSPFRTDKW